MKVLVACEFSGIVRNAFAAKGHDAWSCDLLPSETEGNHIEGDVRNILNQNWDLMIAHPPCTYLAVSGARWWKQRQQEQRDAIDFVITLWEASIERIMIENPVGILPRFIGPSTQDIEPRHFGHAEMKKTCLWLKNLKPLCATHLVSRFDLVPRAHYESPGPNRWKNRSRTLEGIANAMAAQWG